MPTPADVLPCSGSSGRPSIRLPSFAAAIWRRLICAGVRQCSCTAVMWATLLSKVCCFVRAEVVLMVSKSLKSHSDLAPLATASSGIGFVASSCLSPFIFQGSLCRCRFPCILLVVKVPRDSRPSGLPEGGHRESRPVKVPRESRPLGLPENGTGIQNP